VTTSATLTPAAPRSGPAPAPPGPRSGFGRFDTPTRLWIILTSVVVVLLLFSVSSAVTLAQRAATATRTTDQVAALVDNVQELYNALADADATSATAVLDGSAPPARFATAFNADVAQAVNSMAQADRNLTGDPADSTALTELAQQLPVYTGLIGTADADSRLGYPLGAAYLREASNLMRATMLPEVTGVLAREQAAEEGGLTTVGGPPWWVLGFLAVAILTVGYAWRQLARITRRRINAGLGVGGLLGVALLAWTLTATVGAAGSAAGARTDFQRMNATLHLRSDLALAESDQALALISNGEDNGAAARQETAQLRLIVAATTPRSTEGRLAAAVTKDAAHVQQLTASGDYTGAVAATVGTGTQAGAGDVVRDLNSLDQALAADAAAQHSTYDAAAAAVVHAFGAGLWIALALGLLAALAAALGVNRRLAEYR
jgi:hypothetical protein